MKELRERKQPPWYFITILTFLLIPLGALISGWKKVDLRAGAKAMGLIVLLGYAWSMLVSASGWWHFNPEIMLGVKILPHLPLEEILFYPLGGGLSILIYAGLSKKGDKTESDGKRIFIFVLAGFTLGIGILALISTLRNGRVPQYILSQLILYNALFFGLWLKIQNRLSIRPAALTAAIMTVMGFFWNWLAFTRGWWSYHAVMGWMWPARVPIDDWNFYLFAPLAAISLYVAFFRPGSKGT